MIWVAGCYNQIDLMTSIQYFGRTNKARIHSKARPFSTISLQLTSPKSNTSIGSCFSTNAPQTTTNRDISNRTLSALHNISTIKSNIFKTQPSKTAQQPYFRVKTHNFNQHPMTSSHKKLPLKIAFKEQYESTECVTSNRVQSSAQRSQKLGDFRIIRRIGEGKFGEVLMVVHRKTGFVCALKVLKKARIAKDGSKEDSLKRLINQIKLQMYLNHPNIIKLYDFFADRENVYLLVQLGCDGHLFSLLQSYGPFTQEITSIITRDILSGVQHLHSKDIIHRDLKLQNIVFTHGMAKLCDFGWSVQEKSELRSTLCGTPLYLAPEMLKRQHYSNKIDIWAIGTMTYEMFTNQHAFKVTKREQLPRIIYEQFQINSGSPALRSFLGLLLKKDPSKRLDADLLLQHPFIRNYKDLQTSDQLSQLSSYRSA